MVAKTLDKTTGQLGKLSELPEIDIEEFGTKVKVRKPDMRTVKIQKPISQMTSIDEKMNLEKTRKYSIIEGVAATVASGFGEAYVTAFAVAINSSNTLIALLTAIPNLIAPIFQSFTPKTMEKYGRKRLIVPGVFAQACTWLLLAIVAFLFMQGFHHSPYLLLLFYTLYAIIGHFIAPAWTSLMGDIVPGNKGEYWAKRSMICGVVGLVTTFAAGVFLDAFKNFNLMLSFIIIFTVAFVGRGVSSYFFTKHYEPPLRLPRDYYFSFVDFLKRIKGNNFGRYASFIAVGTFVGHITWPFIPVYMLRELHFDYTTFTIVTLAESFAAIISMLFWGRYVDRKGNLKALWLSNIGLCLTPILWTFSTNVYYLIVVQLLRGVASAGFGIVTTSYLFDAVTPQRRSLCSAYSAILNGMGIFFGAILGGILLSLDFGINPFIFTFLVTGVANLIITAVMLPGIKEVNKNAISLDGGIH